MKIERIEKAYVSVAPDYFGTLDSIGAERLQKQLKDMMREIKRHVDVGEMDWHIERESYCSLCGRVWESDFATGEPLCCSLAYTEWESAHAH